MLYVIIAVAIIILLIFTLLFSKFKIYFEYKKYTCAKNSKDHGFYHFGSKFLEDFLSSAQTPGFTSIISGGTGTSCIVTDANPRSPFNRNCRWVDYKNPRGDYLAFK